MESFIVGWGGEGQGCPKEVEIDWPALWKLPREPGKPKINTMGRARAPKSATPGGTMFSCRTNIRLPIQRPRGVAHLRRGLGAKVYSNWTTTE